MSTDAFAAQPLTTVFCKQCHSSNAVRSARKTFLEREVLLRVGLYPWRCLTCKRRFFSRDRGHY